MRSSFGCAEYLAGDDAEDQRCDDCEKQGRAYCHTDLGPCDSQFALLVVWALHGYECQVKIVGSSQSGVEQTDDGQPNRAALNGYRKRIELAEEAACERNAG